jgi:hypothetical protein
MYDPFLKAPKGHAIYIIALNISGALQYEMQYPIAELADGIEVMQISIFMTLALIKFLDRGHLLFSSLHCTLQMCYST